MVLDGRNGGTCTQLSERYKLPAFTAYATLPVGSAYVTLCFHFTYVGSPGGIRTQHLTDFKSVASAYWATGPCVNCYLGLT